MIPTIFCGPNRARRGSARAKSLRASKKKVAAGAEAAGGGLHAEQHYVYHRHPKPGDVLTATVKPGKKWEKQGKRSGKLLFSETVTEYRDQTGELVVTARSIGVQTERPRRSVGGKTWHYQRATSKSGILTKNK